MSTYAKASLDVREVKEKIRCGCDGIEYNLTDDFLTLGDKFKQNYPDEIFRMKNVEVVHVPWVNGQMMNMEHIFQHEDLSPIENVFRLGQYCADIWGHRELVVIHCSLSMFDFMEYEIFRKRLVEALGSLFREYPQVDMAIENVIPMEYKPFRKETPRLCNGIFMDTVEITRYLRERFGDRTGTVLDTCHAAMTEKYLMASLKLADFLGAEKASEIPGELDYSMEHYFEMNQGICKLIHFNDFIGNGYQKNHGTGFDSQEKVDGILGLYRRYGYDCPLTLEIREDDYEDCVNYRNTKRLVEDWIQRQA